MQRRVFALLATIMVAGACTSEHVERPAQAAGHRVLYRIIDIAGGTRRVHFERVEIRRPFDGRVEEVHGDRVRSGRVTNREHLWQITEGGELLFGVRRPPGGAARDVSYAALADAAADGVVSSHGGDTVRGRRCTWFAYGDTPPRPLRPARRSTRIESCVDRGGVVLRENWVLGGRNARIVEATRVDSRPPSDARFLVGKSPQTERVKQREAEAVLRVGFIVVDNARISGVPFEVRPPAGWRLERRSVYAIGGGDRGGAPTQLLSEAYVAGTGLAIVERGTSANLSPPWGPNEGREVSLGGQGVGRLVYFADRVEIRLVGGRGFARVIAPSRAVALDFARRIAAAPRAIG